MAGTWVKADILVPESDRGDAAAHVSRALTLGGFEVSIDHSPSGEPSLTAMDVNCLTDVLAYTIG